MGKFVNTIAIWMVCIVFSVAFGIYEFSVVGVLASLICACACLLVPSGPVRATLLCVLVLLCAIAAPVTPFLPVAACLCAFERRRALQLAWTLGWIGAFARMGLDSIMLLVLCLACVLIAWAASSEAFAKAGALNARDGMREMMLSMGGERVGDPGAAATERLEPQPDPFEDLTERERQVAELVAQGLDNRQIAAELYLSEGTVRNNISVILAKKHLQNRTQLAILALTA